MTFKELCQAFPNFTQFDCEGFWVTEWDAGPECIVSFKQQINEGGLFLNEILYWAFLMQTDQAGGRGLLDSPLSNDVCGAVEYASKRLAGS